MALASSVTASAILGRKGATCSPGTGNLLCCASSSPFSQLPSDQQTTISQLESNELNSNFNASQIVGSNCNAPSKGSPCSNQALCCNSSVLNITSPLKSSSESPTVDFQWRVIFGAVGDEEKVHHGVTRRLLVLGRECGGIGMGNGGFTKKTAFGPICSLLLIRPHIALLVYDVGKIPVGLDISPSRQNADVSGSSTSRKLASPMADGPRSRRVHVNHPNVWNALGKRAVVTRLSSRTGKSRVTHDWHDGRTEPLQ
ncbi:hypothetical protein EI94DRAFT_1701028 [Lactarius quietus]|nr:hypothetical protein EI94DRAFT_1701028 [Lactarius quietus]